jgi:hypothetical protein
MVHLRWSPATGRPPCHGLPKARSHRDFVASWFNGEGWRNRHHDACWRPRRVWAVWADGASGEVNSS